MGIDIKKKRKKEKKKKNVQSKTKNYESDKYFLVIHKYHINKILLIT